ncbi:hypothetical protein R6Q59_004288 [Mikania micrantha]
MSIKIYNVMKKFKFRQQVGFIQFWEATSSCNDTDHMINVGQLYRLNGNHEGLTNYRTDCLNYKAPIGPDTQVDQTDLAVLAAQTGFAYQETSNAPGQFMGQLVMPVYTNMCHHQTFLGVIEFVTLFPKASYVDDFKHLKKLLENEKLTTPEEKIIKVVYETRYMEKINIMFSLPWTYAGMDDLWGEVTLRLPEVNPNDFQINGNWTRISSDDDLQACIADLNSLKIRMFIEYSPYT